MAGSGDVRISCLCGAVAADFGLATANDSALASLHDDPTVARFLNEAGTPLLVVRRDSDGTFTSSGSLNPAAANPGDAARGRAVCFYKVRPEAIDAGNLCDNVCVASLGADPMKALYDSVRQVYAPALLHGRAGGDAFDDRLQNLLGELEAGMGSALLHGGHGGAGNSDMASNAATRRGERGGGNDGEGNTDYNLSVVQTPQDELRYWAEVAARAARLPERERAQYFQGLLQPLAADFNAAGSGTLGMLDLVELVEKSQECLDDIWRQTEHDPYPSKRMSRLLSVLESALRRAMQARLGALDLWGDAFHTVREDLRAGLTVGARWSAAVGELTGTLWPRDPANPWHQERVVPLALQELAARLEEILTLRTVHEQLVRLVGPEEAAHLGTDKVFDAFRGLNPLHSSAYIEPLWRAAVADYERRMVPAEQAVARVLRHHFSGLETHPHQLLREFLRYRDLVCRPSIRTQLVSERQLLLTKLRQYVDDVREEFGNGGGDGSGKGGAGGGVMPAGKNMPEVVNEVVWCKQLAARVEEVVQSCDVLLGDIGGEVDTFISDTSTLLEELKAYQTQHFETWVQTASSALAAGDGGDLHLETSGRLMHFDHADGQLLVHYSDRLVVHLREVRQLAALGFVVPHKLQRVAATARKFYKHGVVLKQVAHFYNTLDSQIIESQYLMLENQARTLEAIVKNPGGSSGGGGVTWDNPEQLQAYTERLQAAASKLMADNRRLRQVHHTFGERVTQLMGTDLLRQQSKWKEGLAFLRQQCAQLQAEGYPPAAMRPWQVHWDHQLYKALEHQYQLGLESLNELLPELRIDLVFRQQRGYAWPSKQPCHRQVTAAGGELVPE